jgi:GNAT superfamily N-acetyltransferase
VGMLVHPEHRKRGVGTYIIQYLKEYCMQNLWRPICGCAKQNVSSRKTLERAGFVSKYDLLEFEF